MAGGWRQLRAGLLALAIALGLVEGCPIPPRHETLAWQRPLVETIRPAQEAVIAPFRWVNRGLRFSQRWALMQVGPRDAFRLVVEGRPAAAGADGPWALLYRGGDPAHAAFAEVLEAHRVYGAWAPTVRPSSRQPVFARWFARHVLAARPDLAAIRVRYERVVIEDGALRPTGVFAWGSEHRREVGP